MIQHRLAPTPMTERVYGDHLNPLAQRFIDALALTAPDVPRVDWVWRYTIMAHAVVFSSSDVGSDNRPAVLSRGQADATRREELRSHLLDFLCAALAARPSTTPATDTRTDKPGGARRTAKAPGRAD